MIYTAETVAKRMAGRAATQEKLKKDIADFVAKYGPQLIETYEENGLTIKRYEARNG